jgi:hypothetical protein
MTPVDELLEGRAQERRWHKRNRDLVKLLLNGEVPLHGEHCDAYIRRQIVLVPRNDDDRRKKQEWQRRFEWSPV